VVRTRLLGAAFALVLPALVVVPLAAAGGKFP
jgi:hypothetical protein